MTKLIYIAAGIIIFLGVIIVVGAWATTFITPHLELKDYLLNVQITLTFLAALVAALLSVAVARQQAMSIRSTEELKARLAQVAPKEHEAYHAMWRAVSQYYRTLAELELGRFSNQSLQDAEEACKTAEGQSLLADPADIGMFYRFWQMAANLRDEAANRQNYSDELRKLWIRDRKSLSDEYNQVKAAFSKRIRSS